MSDPPQTPPGAVPVTLSERLRRAERVAARSTLASSFVHKLGTPLNVLLGRANMILATPELDERLTKNAKVIVDTAQKMVDDLQAMAASERSIAQHVEPVDMVDCVTRALHMFEPIANQRAIRLEPDGFEPLTCALDPVHVLQLVTCKVAAALAGRGGTLRVELRREQIEQPADLRCSPGTYVVVRLRRRYDPEVDDSAVEIGREGLDGESPDDDWLAKEDVQIARMMGGFVTQENEGDRVVTFSLFWPYREAEPATG